jgi:ribosome-associated toxin RatA of RatAB toxin-antitoxin module
VKLHHKAWKRTFWIALPLLVLLAIPVIRALQTMQTLQVSVALRTPPSSLWKAISDHQALPHHVSMLREVRLVNATEQGVGTVRQCTLRNGRAFHEKITAWEEGRRYCYEPNVAEARFPFQWAEACWSVEPMNDGSRLTYRLQYKPASRFKGVINYALLRTYGVWQIKKMLRSYEQSR